MKQPFIILSAILLFIVTAVTASAQANFTKITSYKVYYGWAKHAPQDWMIIRQFEDDGKSYF